MQYIKGYTGAVHQGVYWRSTSRGILVQYIKGYTGAVHQGILVQYIKVYWCGTLRYTGAVHQGILVRYISVRWLMGNEVVHWATGSSPRQPTRQPINQPGNQLTNQATN